MEAMLGLLLGLVLSFVFEWKMALLALAISPPLLVTNIFLAKMQTGLVDTDDKGNKEMQSMISDAIVNYQTVASFGHQHLIADYINEMLRKPLKKKIIKANIAGFILGFS